MGKLFKYFYNKSELSRTLLAVSIGLLAKLFSIFIVIVAVPLIEVSSHLGQQPFSGSTSLHSAGSIWNNPYWYAALILFLAPIVENLIFPFVFWATKLLRGNKIISIFVITFISFFYHFNVNHNLIFGMTGAAGFFILSIYFAGLKNLTSTWRSYYYTVIAHATANLIALVAGSM